MNSKTIRAASDSFHSQIHSNSHKFLELILLDTVVLHSATLVNVHPRCIKCRITVCHYSKSNLYEISHVGCFRGKWPVAKHANTQTLRMFHPSRYWCTDCVLIAAFLSCVQLQHYSRDKTHCFKCVDSHVIVPR